MFRTIQAVTTRVAIVVALASPAACAMADDDPGQIEEFVRVVRAEGLTGDEVRCAGDAVATYSRGDTVLSM
jgi:hypothetical protein